ncbi:hypothetical protein [Haloferula sp.]|uniref:hypothetical protein n=1 Tax=Haloferula sp. TaxID=2497595 RepID=UPI003C7472F4
MDQQLQVLASFILRSGVGNVDHRSIEHSENNVNEWIRIDLETGSVFDQVVLVPTLLRDYRLGFQTDGFPVEFQILAGKDGEEGRQIAYVNNPPDLLPRIVPLVISVPTTEADWITVEALELSTHAWDGKFIFQLSEVLVFDGDEDIALHRPVEASSIRASDGRIRSTANLVDGFVPYYMDAKEGELSVAMLTAFDIGEKPFFTVDLGSSVPVNRIHLHEIELSDSVPQVATDDMGLPRHLIIEGSDDAGFQDPVFPTEYLMRTQYDAGPIIMLRLP